MNPSQVMTLEEPGWRVRPAMTDGMTVLCRHCGHGSCRHCGLDPQSRFPSNPGMNPSQVMILKEPRWRVRPAMTDGMTALCRHCGLDPQSRLPNNPRVETRASEGDCIPAH